MSTKQSPSPTEAVSTEAVPYRITVHHLEVCNCNHGCGCQFGGFPDHGACEAMIGLEVIDGEYGSVDLSGTRAVIGVKWPGAIHEGGGHVVLFVDENSSDKQVEGLATILSGQAGGMPWEVLAGTIDELEGPIRAPIAMIADGRRSSYSVPGVLDVRMAPLINPVSEKEQDVNIRYPSGGFMWDEGEVGTTDTMEISHDGMDFRYPGQFAVYARPTWTNQA